MTDEEESQEKQQQHQQQQVPAGASSLVNLFAPPPHDQQQVTSGGSNSTSRVHNHTAGSASSHGSAVPPGASSLMELFAPPPGSSPAAQGSNSSAGGSGGILPVPKHDSSETKKEKDTATTGNVLVKNISINSNSSNSNGSLSAAKVHDAGTERDESKIQASNAAPSGNSSGNVDGSSSNGSSTKIATEKAPGSVNQNAQSLASAAANRALVDLFQPPDAARTKPPPQDRPVTQQAFKIRADSASGSVAPPSPPKSSPPKKSNLKKARTRTVTDSSSASSISPEQQLPPRSQLLPYPDRNLVRQSTAPRSNKKIHTTEQLQQWWIGQSPASLSTPKAMGGQQKVYNATSSMMNDAFLEPPLLTSIGETTTETSSLLPSNRTGSSRLDRTDKEPSFVQKHFGPTTFIGSFMFLLYHIVFCLAMGSSITRSGSSSVLGIMAKVTCVGIIFASPVFVYRMGNQIPSLYATNDLFLAPFLANLATIVDETLLSEQQQMDKEDDQVFFATFMTLSGIGMVLSGTLLVLASRFKLANLGTYLPYPVLCGFFSAVGIMLWALSFAVDTNGRQWQAVLRSGDLALWRFSLRHHAPSLLVGVTMKWLGPKNPFYVSLLVITTILAFYIVMWITGTSLQEAQGLEWFWSKHDLVYEHQVRHIGFDAWATPAPFGVVNSLIEGKVHWGAVWKGMPTVCALAFLYLLRCSLHATALKKNISNLRRMVPIDETEDDAAAAKPKLLRDISNGLVNAIQKSPMAKRRDSFGTLLVPPSANSGSSNSGSSSTSRAPKKKHHRYVSEVVDIPADIEAVVDGSNGGTNTQNGGGKKNKFREIRAKNTKMTLQEILMDYAYSQYLVAVVGGFVVCPSIAIAPTMYAIGAEGVAPQYGSVILLLIFYLTNFQLVCYIPKAAFSCLLVLAACDMIITWFVNSFHKTKDVVEWLVVPLIVVFAFVVGLLNAVFLGVAISTFIFVASFFRTGVVKYAATGLTIRSTIERSMTAANWLDQNGDLIQILVIQNYLFFGNASSILHYITTMFEEPDIAEQANLTFQLPPMPKIIILDMTLISGMDTSTVDVFSDIQRLSASHDCKLFLSGLKPRMRSILALGGVKVETVERSKRHLRMFPDLDSALGKAEDLLVRDLEQEERVQRPRLLSEGDNGFRFALRKIDEQHGKEFAIGLVPLHRYTTPVELEPGEPLFSCDGELLHERQRGLFFIEYGMLKIERDTAETLTRGSFSSLRRRPSRNDLTRMNARTGSIGRQAAELKGHAHETSSQNLRLARIGPGWVVGAIEGVTGLKNPGCHVAVSFCRLHHLPYAKIAEIEEENPVLILRLYKMLAHLMARRQEVTIEQLATLHSIMTSPALTKPVSRATQGALASIQSSLK